MSISSKRFFGFAAVVFGILVSATAVAHTDGIYNPTANSVGDTQGIDSNAAAGVVAYTGPGDIVAFTFWGGLRAFSSATRGTKAINVCNVADAACADLSTDLTTGALVVTTIGGSSCAVVVCTVKTIYDKAGTNDATQATIGNRPVLTQNALNSSWGMTSTTGASPGMLTAGTYTASQPYSLVILFNATAASTLNVMSVDSGFTGAALFYNAGTTTFTLFSGSNLDRSMTAAFHAVETVSNGASSIIGVDGAETTGNAGANNLSALKLGLPGEPSGNAIMSGVIMEGGYVAGTIGPANRTALNANMHAAYGGF